MRLLFLLLFLILSSARHPSHDQHTLEEIRAALYDIRHAYSEQQMEMQLLDERVAKVTSFSSKELEKRLSELEKTQEKILTDLHKLSSFAEKTSLSLTDYKAAITTLEKQVSSHSDKLNEVIKLKSTLNSISKAMGPSSSGRIHKVSSGDTLEKIARKYGTSIDRLKQLNGLTTSTIIVGQELKIPE